MIVVGSHRYARISFVILVHAGVSSTFSLSNSSMTFRVSMNTSETDGAFRHMRAFVRNGGMEIALMK